MKFHSPCDFSRLKNWKGDNHQTSPSNCQILREMGRYTMLQLPSLSFNVCTHLEDWKPHKPSTQIHRFEEFSLFHNTWETTTSARLIEPDWTSFCSRIIRRAKQFKRFYSLGTAHRIVSILCKDFTAGCGMTLRLSASKRGSWFHEFKSLNQRCCSNLYGLPKMLQQLVSLEGRMVPGPNVTCELWGYPDTTLARNTTQYYWVSSTCKYSVNWVLSEYQSWALQ